MFSQTYTRPLIELPQISKSPRFTFMVKKHTCMSARSKIEAKSASPSRMAAHAKIYFPTSTEASIIPCVRMSLRKKPRLVIGSARKNSRVLLTKGSPEKRAELLDYLTDRTPKPRSFVSIQGSVKMNLKRISIPRVTLDS